MNCPVCQSSVSEEFAQDKFRPYFKCSDCSLVYIPREFILKFDAEAERYEAHQNDERDEQYKKYLSQIVDGIKGTLKKNHRGLDFGCGKTTLLSKLIGEHGPTVDSYDLLFHPDIDIWSNKYDFIVLSEVVEHLSDPRRDLLKLAGLLNPKGQIFIKTKLYPKDKIIFDQWFYKRDPTHVQFFDLESLGQIANILKMKGPKVLGTDLFQFNF